MLERQPKPVQRLKESGRKNAETAMLYFAALSAFPSLLLLSMRIRNTQGDDFNLTTLEEGSYHVATREHNSRVPAWYIPGGATVSVEGFDRELLIKDMKTFARVFVGNEDAKVTPTGNGKKISFYLHSEKDIYVDPAHPIAPIEDTGLEAEFFFENLDEVDEHY